MKGDEIGEGEGRKERVDESLAWSRACGGSWERNADTGPLTREAYNAHLKPRVPLRDARRRG